MKDEKPSHEKPYYNSMNTKYHHYLTDSRNLVCHDHDDLDTTQVLLPGGSHLGQPPGGNRRPILPEP
ncbi:MAG: hypothetical protein IID32_04855 [Planctomycetes bacterium]|nr:hypothetical protein [Planctomycetota bacterium]